MIGIGFFGLRENVLNGLVAIAACAFCAGVVSLIFAFTLRKALLWKIRASFAVLGLLLGLLAAGIDRLGLFPERNHVTN
jgi:uncharacterized membrane protein HdeD (DUF308 family)